MRLVSEFLAGRSAATIRAYGADLDEFRAFIGTPDTDAAVERLLRMGHRRANTLVLAYQTGMVDRGLAANTINRRVATLRSLVRWAAKKGLTTWSLFVGNVEGDSSPSESEPEVAAKLFGLLGRESRKTRRDRAILSLIWNDAFRPGDVTRLRVNEVPAELSPSTLDAIRDWVEVRGDEPGPMFVPLDNGHRAKAGALSGTAIYDIVHLLGLQIGLEVTPNSLRNGALREAREAHGASALEAFRRRRRQ